MDPELWELIEQGDSEDEIAAIARLGQPGVVPQGVRIVAQLGDIATIRLKRGDTKRIRAEEAVTSLKAPGFGLAPDLELDSVAPPENLPELLLSGNSRRPPSITETGRGVCVGIVDWGFDFAHPDFLHEDGSTRILSLWDQRASPSRRSPQPYGYGITHTSEEINKALAGQDPYSALRYHPADADTGQGSHGTLVASIAAGNGRGGGPLGVAPEADLVLVHLSAWGHEVEKLGDSVTLLEAVHFIVRTVDNRPWVINLSMGRHGEQHDGSLPVVQGLDALLRSAPGGCIVQSCGNYFERGIHASGQLRPAEERILVWEIKEGDVTPNELEVWYPGRDVFDVEIRSPDGLVSARAALGEQTSLTADGRKIGNCYHRPNEPNTLDHQIEIILYPGAPAGGWEVVLIGKDVTDGRFHCWIERDAICPQCQSRFRPEDAVSSFTTGTICNGLRTIAVGAYNPHSAERELARFSSSGPTRDERVKPDCIAPGQSIVGARSAPRDRRADAPLLTAMSGTSFACPHVTGTVALMFEAAKRPLRIEEIHNLLLANTEHVTGPEEILNRVGSGYLDIAKAVEAARKIGTGGPQFQPYLHRKTQEAAVSSENMISSMKSRGPSSEKRAEAEQSKTVPGAASVNLRVGQKIRFVLEQATDTDCFWKHSIEGPPGVVEFSTEWLGGQPTIWSSIGGGRYCLVSITALMPGQVKVHLIYAQPGVGDRPPEKEEVLEIAVQSAAEEAAKRDDRFTAAPQFQFQVPISGGGAPALAFPVGGPAAPLALTVPLGGTTPTAPPPAVGQTGGPVPSQPAGPEPPGVEPPAEPVVSDNGMATQDERRETEFVEEKTFERTQTAERNAAEFVELADQAVAECATGRAPLEILSPMEVLRRVPRAAMTESLISPSTGQRLSAVELFDSFAYPGREALRDQLERNFEVVALPRAPLDGKLRAGDLAIRRGAGGFGHLSIIASPELRSYEQLLSEGLTPEVIGPGKYAQVIETGVRPHTLAEAFARRIADAEGRSPYDQLVLRLREDVPSGTKIQPHITLAISFVVVKKTYTSPKRQAVTLSADAGFKGKGTFERSKKAIRFFGPLGKEITFDGKDNVFTDAELAAPNGVKLLAEGATASTALGDVVLTLTLTPAPGAAGTALSVGPPATAKMTAVELMLDICTTRATPGTDPSPLPQPPATKPAVPTDKWFAGRPVGFRGRRALLIATIKPAAFASYLVLRQVKVAGDTITGLDTKAQLFDTETGGTANKNPHEFHASAIPKGGQRFFVEGAELSAALRDTGVQFGIRGVDDDGDRIALTVFSVVLIEARLRATPCRRVGGRGDLDLMPAKESRADSKTIDATAITLARECGDLSLRAAVQPAAIPITWDKERAADDKGLTGLPTLGPDPASPADNKRRVLRADATGSFHAHAFVDVNGNGKRGTDEDGIIMNVNMVKIEVMPGAANNKIIKRDTLFNNARSTATTLVVDSSSTAGVVPAVNAAYTDPLFTNYPLSEKVTVKLTGGGGDQRRGVDRVGLGYIQTTTADSVRGTYADGRTVREVIAQNAALANPITAGMPPMLAFPVRDTRGAGNNGTGPFIVSSSDNDRSNIAAGGQKRVVRYVEPPVIALPMNHPVTGAALASISGSNNFAMFLSAFSTDFDENYTVIASAEWSLTYGTFSAAGGWTNAGAHVTAAGAMTVHSPARRAEATNAERCAPNFVDNIKLDAR